LQGKVNARTYIGAMFHDSWEVLKEDIKKEIIRELKDEEDKLLAFNPYVRIRKYIDRDDRPSVLQEINAVSTPYERRALTLHAMKYAEQIHMDHISDYLKMIILEYPWDFDPLGDYYRKQNNPPKKCKCVIM